MWYGLYVNVCFFVMIRRPPRSTRTDTLVPYTTLFRSTQRAERRIPGDANADRQPWLPTETVEVFGERSDRVRISGVRRAARACAPECIGIACLAGRDLARIVGGIGGNDEEIGRAHV